MLAAIVLAGGGTTAHAAIVARSLGIPLVTGAGPGVLAAALGDEIGVDADRGMVWIAPDSATARRGCATTPSGWPSRPTATAASGASRPAPPTAARVRLLANAGTAPEVMAALDAGAEGIGLLRSELAFLEADAPGRPRSSTRACCAPCSSRSATASRRCGRSTSAATRRRPS